MGIQVAIVWVPSFYVIPGSNFLPDDDDAKGTHPCCDVGGGDNYDSVAGAIAPMGAPTDERKGLAILDSRGGNTFDRGTAPNSLTAGCFVETTPIAIEDRAVQVRP